MTSSSAKRTKPTVNIHTLATQDREALERAAELLGKPLTELLGVPPDDCSHAYATHGTLSPQ
jgi:hypothetical protein